MNSGIRGWPAAERPRERLLGLGPDGLSDAEVLAVLLRTGHGSADAVAVARSLLKDFGDLRRLLDAPVEVLLAVEGLGPAKVAVLKAGLALAERYLRCHLERPLAFPDSAAVRRFASVKLGGRPAEVFAVLFLDSRHRLIDYRELFRGTIDAASVYPREVLRAVMAANAAAVILVHNHPSGVAEPSATDVALTERLKRLLGEVDVRVLDHLVVGAAGAVSMAERGLI